MKKTNRVLIVFGGVILLLLVASIVTARILVEANTRGQKTAGAGLSSREYTGATIEKSYSFTGFTEIEIEGVWDVNLVQADDYSVRATVPDRIADMLNIHVSGHVLKVDLMPGANRRPNRSNLKLKLSIHIPDLHRVTIGGAVTLFMQGFTSPSLAIGCFGAGSIKGEAVTVQDLRLNAGGASSIDLKDSKARNADIILSGTGSIVLTMDGGDLNAKISGIGNITYYGSVRSERVHTSGLGSVNAR